MLGGNALGFRGNTLGIHGRLRESAATGGDFTATGQEFSARAQQFMAEPWELPAMFGESVAAGWDLTATLRDSAAASGTARQWLGNARQAIRIPWRGSENPARSAGNLRPHSGRRFRDWGNERGPCREHGDMVRQARPCVPGEILSTDATELFTNTTMTARKKIRITILGKYFA